MSLREISAPMMLDGILESSRTWRPVPQPRSMTLSSGPISSRAGSIDWKRSRVETIGRYGTAVGIQRRGAEGAEGLGESGRGWRVEGSTFTERALGLAARSAAR